MADEAVRERRSEPRKKRHLFCQLFCGERQYPAVVLDVSPSGLFVRTTATAPPGTPVEVIVRLAGGQVWTLEAVIAREPQADASLDPVPARGLGLRITRPPEGFADFVEAL